MFSIEVQDIFWRAKHSVTTVHKHTSVPIWDRTSSHKTIPVLTSPRYSWDCFVASLLATSTRYEIVSIFVGIQLQEGTQAIPNIRPSFSFVLFVPFVVNL